MADAILFFLFFFLLLFIGWLVYSCVRPNVCLHTLCDEACNLLLFKILYICKGHVFKKMMQPFLRFYDYLSDRSAAMICSEGYIILSQHLTA